MSLEPESEFAGYRVERLIGEGGMGYVYLARHAHIKKLFALKVLKSGLSEKLQSTERFVQEIDIIATLDHPNIVPVTDGRCTDGQFWYAMSFVDGVDASSALTESGPMSPESALRIVTAVASALDYSHARRVLHRDVKPANILLEKDSGTPEGGRIFLTDFGIARFIDMTNPLTSTGSEVLSLAFASPEQLLGRRDLDARSDVYALGSTFFALLTASAPFPESPFAKLARPAPRPRDVAPAATAVFDTVLSTAMAYERDDRYRTCGELAAAAQDAIKDFRTDRSTRTDPPVGFTNPGPPPRKKRRSLLIGIAVLTLVAAITVLVLTRSSGNGEIGPGDNGGGSLSSEAGPVTTNPAGQAVPLADLLNPAPERLGGTVAGKTLAGAPAFRMQPKGCPQGSREFVAQLNGGYTKVSGNIQLDDAAPAGTRMRFTASADGTVLETDVLSPLDGRSVELQVTDKITLSITLESLGPGVCDSDDYLVFFTSALAYP